MANAIGSVAGPRGPSVGRRRRAWTAAVAATGLIVATGVGVSAQGSERPEHMRLTFDVLPIELVIALVLVAAVWAAAWTSADTAAGMLALTLGTVLPLWAGWPVLSPFLRAAAAASAPIALAGAVSVALRWRGNRDSGARNAVLRGISGVAVAAATLQLVLLDPLAELECRRICMAIATPWTDLLDARTTVWLVAALVAGAALVAAIAILGRERTTVPPLVAAGSLAAAGLVAAAAVLRGSAWADGSLADLAVVLAPVAALALSAAVIAESIRALVHRRAVARVLGVLSDPTAEIAGRAGRARTIETVEFAMPRTDRWVDADGRTCPEAFDTVRHRLIRAPDGEPVARLVVTPGSDPSDVAAALTPAARLALRNAQLAAVTRARLIETQASQRRIVESSDAEARRIERDLHDGAQQRLVSASLYLSVAKGALDDIPSELPEAETAIREALAQLRRLAHGFVPTTLATDGLAIALEEATHDASTPATLVFDLERDPAADGVALAAFAVARTGLDAAERIGAASRIGVSRTDDALVVTVAIAGEAEAPDELLDAADRVGAFGGDVRLIREADGTTIEAVIPCVSSSPTT